MKKIFALFLLLPLLGFSQEDLLSEIDIKDTNTKVESAFKSLKIVNLESTKLAAKGDFYSIISHRFGSIKGGAYELFGFDQATTNIKFLYGVTDWLTLGASRTSKNKTYDFTAKYALLTQKTDGSPVNVVGFNSFTYNTLRKFDLSGTQRISYVTQILVSRKFNQRLSFQIAPTYFHENFVENDMQKNSQYALGVGGRVKITSRLSFNADYAHHLNRASNSPFKNPLSVGVDLETGGHVFQMHFTNASLMNETGYLANASGDWSTANIFFGFNLVRVF